jgi:hypothetical protein
MAFKLKLDLHKTQIPVYNDPHRFKVIAAGRQWGKSTMVTRAAGGIALTKDNSLGMVVAPYAKQAYKDWKDILSFIPSQYVENKSARWMTFELKNGSEIMMGSAENIDGLRGYTLDWVLVDEAAYCDQEIWEVLEPSLGKKKGQGFFISTPNGKGWFYDLYCREQKDSGFKSFHFTTYDNPHFPVSEIERMRNNMPEVMFRQEVMAEFLEGGIVFPHLNEVMTSTECKPIPGHHYVMGADIASTNDFTVLKVFDTADNHERFHTRFTSRDWGYNRTEIYTICKLYNNATLIIDKTGVGAPVVEDLMKMDCAYSGAQKQGYLTVVPIIFSSVSKPQLYTNYIMAHENRTIRLLNEPITRKEHEDFLARRSQDTTGYMKYGAPKGRNDDTVTAAALAAWGLEKICGGGSALIGGTDDELLPGKKKALIDPSCQIDTDGIIRQAESRQIAGFGYGSIDDFNIISDYKEED